MVRHMMLAAVLALTGAGSAQALFFTSRADFDAANPGLTVLTFEDIAPAGDFVLPVPDFAAQGVTFGSRFGDPINVGVADSGFFGTPTDVLFAVPFNSIEINFAPGVRAVGFNLSTSGVNAVVRVFGGDTELDTRGFLRPEPLAVFTTFAGFSGFESDITRVVLGPGVRGQVFLDNLTFGTVVIPEPAGVTLIGLGVGGLIGIRLRWKPAV